MIELGLSGFAAVILAGGQASRLGGLDHTGDEPGDPWKADPMRKECLDGDFVGCI